MSRTWSKLVLIAAAVFSVVPLFGHIVGSTSVVSLEPATEFLSTDTYNLIQGFAWMKNGFTLEDSSTTCTFNGLFPISGTVNLNGGSLYLAQDFVFRNKASFNSAGTILGDSYRVDLCTSMTCLPAGNVVLDNVDLNVRNDMCVTGTVLVRGDCCFSVNNHSLCFGAGGSFLIDSGASLTIINADLSDVSDGQLVCVDDTASLVLDDVSIEQDGDIIFSQGSILFKNNVDFRGSYTFSYESHLTSTIDMHATLKFTDGTCFKVGRQEIAPCYEPITMFDQTSKIVFDNCDFHVTASGACFTKGQAVFIRDVDCYMDGYAADNGVILGNGVPGEDISFYYTAGCRVILHGGAFTYNNTDPRRIKTSARTARLCRTKESYVYIQQDCVIDGITIELLESDVPSIIVADGKQLNYDEAGIIAPGVEFEFTGGYVNGYMNSLRGNEYVSLTKGQLPIYLYIANSGNVVEGTGSILGQMIFQDSNAQLTWKGDGYIVNSINLAGGTMTLGGKMYFCGNGEFSGPGTIDLGISTLTLCEKEAQLVPPLLFTSQSGKIDFREKLSISNTCTFEGTCMIDGNDGVLDLGETGELIVADNSTLKLCNMKVCCLHDKNIRCLTDSGQLVLNNVILVQDDDYMFDAGSMHIMNEVIVSGGNTFIYESKQTTSIDSFSTLKFECGVTCSVTRAACNDEPGPFICECPSSVLYFDNSTLVIHTNGLMLTKGTVYCSRDFVLDIYSTSTENGLIMGDGTAEGDMIFQFIPGSSVRFPRGHVVYNVTTDDGLRSSSNTACIVRSDDSIFHLKKNLTLSGITVETTNYATFITDDGVDLSYDDATIALPQGSFEMTGNRYSSYSNLLGGGEYILLKKGYLPAYTLISGAGNTICGTGIVTGGITLLTDQAALTWSMHGTMMNDILLVGGSLTLASNLMLANDYQIKGPGIIHLGGNTLSFGENDLTYTSTLYWDGNGVEGAIELNSDIALSGRWTFSGNCLVEGHGHTLDLGTAGELLVESGSRLKLRNIVLENVNDENIRCLSDSSTLCLSNVVWRQSGGYQFTTGALSIRNKVTISGDEKTFAYQSNQASSIESSSSLLLDSGVTFSYDPTDSRLQDRIIFNDDTSELVLKGATLYVAATGMRLVGGALTIEEDSYLLSEVQTFTYIDPSIEYGISFGDGIDGDDCYVTIKAGVQLTLQGGSLIYNNVAPSAWYMANNLSRLRCNSNTNLYVNQNFVLGDGSLVCAQGSRIYRTQGKKIIGVVHNEQ